jgi:putative membrane protein
MNILIPYLHYIGIMAMMGALVTEHVLLKPGMKKSQILSLAMVDTIYGMSALLVLASGLLRWFIVDPKGMEFFNTNPLFHIKVTLFVVIAVLSVFPTLKFMKWRKLAKQDDSFTVSVEDPKKQLMIIRIELLLLAVIPLLAVMVAAGIRM